MLSSSGEALWRWVVIEGRSEVCVGRVCFAFLTHGGAMAADCVHGGLAYIGMSMGGTNHGAITPTPRKTERACVGNAIEPPLRMRWEDEARAPVFGNRREQRGRGVNAASLRGELKGRDQSKDRVKRRLFMGGHAGSPRDHTLARRLRHQDPREGRASCLQSERHSHGDEAEAVEGRLDAERGRY